MKAASLTGPQVDRSFSLSSSAIRTNQSPDRTSKVAEAVLESKMDSTTLEAQESKSRNACLYRELKNVAYFTCICIMVYLIGSFLNFDRDSFDSKEADFVTDCLQNPGNTSYVEHGSYSEVVVVDSTLTAAYESTLSNVSSLCLGALSLTDPFQALLKETLAGEFSLQKIGEGVNGASYLLSETGDRIAALKPPFEGLNKECLVRDLLGEKLQHMTPPIARVNIAGKSYMAVKYLKNLSLSAFSLFPSNLKKHLRNPSFRENLQVIWLLDLIFKNRDRHLGNLLLTCEGVRAIDNDQLLARGASLSHNQVYLDELGLFDHEGLLPDALAFLNSLTPTFVNEIASKYAKQLQEHFINEDPVCYWMELACDQGVDHVAEFVRGVLTRVSLIKKMQRWQGVSLKSIAKALQNS